MSDAAEKSPAQEPPVASDRLVYPGDWSLRSAYALGVLTLIYTMNYVDRQILALVLPLLKRDMNLTDTQLGLVSGFVFVLFYSLLGVPIARLADRSNRRNILGIGLIFWSAMTALTGMVQNVWHLAATRFLMGAGEAAGIAPSQSMVADMYKPDRRPLAMSILTSGTSLAALIFFPIVGWISQHYGWRVTFAAAGAVGLLLAILLFYTVPEPPRSYSLNTAKPVQEKFWPTIRFLMGSPAYSLGLIGGAFVGISLYAAQIWNPSFLTRVHGLNLTQVGAAIGLLRGALGLAGALLGGLLADYLGKRDPRWRLAVPGLACILVLPAELLFLLAPGVTLSLVGLGLASVFTAMHFGPIYANCQNLARPTMRATAAALFLLFVNLIGQIVGPLIVGVFNDRWAAAYGDMAIRYSLILGAACACIGGALMIVGARYLRDPPTLPTHREHS